MSDDWQTTNPNEQVNKARETAEALFTPKKEAEHTGAPTSAPIVPLEVEQAHREPRIFAMPSVMPVAENVAEEAVDQKPKPKRGTIKRPVKVPASQHGRIRALALYGMTLGEVADFYGVSVDVIARIVSTEPTTPR